MKVSYFLPMIILFFVGNAFSQTKTSNNPPSAATVQFTLINLPGLNDEKSRWEISYELRLINQTEEYAAIKAGKLKQMENEEKIGLLLGKGNFTKNLLSKSENRLFKESISLNREVQEKLNNEPRTRINIADVVMNEKAIALVEEQENRSQVFLLYSSVIVYDAKLKKNLIIPICSVIPFSGHPKTDFEIIVEIKGNAEYTAGLIPLANTNQKTITNRQQKKQ